jgi:protein-disulfide isomerase
MSKRQEIRERRARERLLNRLLVVILVAAGVLLVVFAIVMPQVTYTNNAHATQTAALLTPLLQATAEPVTVAVDGTHLGDPNAPVKVDVYEDFRCSACMYYTTYYEPDIIKNYVNTGKVYYTFHSFIVIDSGDGTDASYRSANAALCASEQGRFWDYHATLFANQITESAELFSDVRLIKMAENLGLDMTKFNKCYQARTYANAIKDDIALGTSLSIQGTPSIFVDGQLIQSFDQVGAAIDAVLAGK